MFPLFLFISFIITICQSKYTDPVNASTLVVFGNVTRVIELDYTTWSISLEDVQTFFKELLQNGSIHESDQVGGPGTTTWNASHGEMIPNAQVSHIIFDWADPLTFDVTNIAETGPQNPFTQNNISIRFPFLAMGVSNYEIEPINLKLTANDINNMEIHEYLNKTIFSMNNNNNIDVAFIRMTGSWTIINASVGYQVNSTIINFKDEKEFMMVGVHVNPTLQYIWTRVCDFHQNEHIHGFGQGKDNNEQGGHIKYGFVNQINVDIWPISQVFIIDINEQTKETKYEHHFV